MDLKFSFVELDIDLMCRIRRTVELNRYNFAIKFECFFTGGGSKKPNGTLVAPKELLHCAL